jgi:hypothetical protein
MRLERERSPTTSSIDSKYQAALAETRRIPHTWRRLRFAGARVDVVVLVLVAVGIGTRLWLYVRNASLSIDEASLGLNLIDRSYSQLFDQLAFNQAAPPGFLLAQRVSISLFGPSPYALRLVPLLAGIATCLLIYPVASRIIGRSWALFALAVVIVSAPLSTYASTNKQYSLDGAVTLALLAIALAVRPRGRGVVILAAAGAIGVWLSHPAAFVLAGIAVASCMESLSRRSFSDLARLAVIAGIWLISFVGAYLVTRTSVEHLQASLGGSTIIDRQGTSNSLRTAGGVVRNILGIPGFNAPSRVALVLVALGLCVAGVVGLCLRRNPLVAALVVPLIAAIVAVAAGLYPDFSRTFLFAIPLLAILIGGGAKAIGDHSRRAQAVVGLLVGGLIVCMAYGIRSTVWRDHGVTRALTYLASNARNGDSLYVNRGAQYDYRYYVECRCFGKPSAADHLKDVWPIHAVEGDAQFAAALRSVPPHLVAGSALSASTREFERDLAPLDGAGRVWIFAVSPDPRVRQALAEALRRGGHRVEAFAQNESAVLLLYDFNPSMS